MPVKRGKECVVRDRARQHVPSFVKNRERLVDRFDVMIRADIAIAVWRRASAELGCSPPSKVRSGPGIVGVGRQRSLISLCNHGEEGASCWWRACPVRIAGQDSLVELLLWRDVRELSQVLVQTDRTNHLHDIRPLRAGSVLRAVGPIVLLDGLCAISLGEQRHSDAEQAKRRSS